MEEMKVGHFLLTRFNVRMNTVLTNQLDKIDITSDMEYLSERFRLFYKYTVPSIVAQTDENFEWIVLFSNNTPDCFKDRLNALMEANKGIKCLFVDDGVDYYAVLNDYLASKQVEWYITSRVDNDDALAVNYIERVKHEILKDEMQTRVLCFNNGYQYDESAGYLTKYYFPSNHFTSMLAHKETVIDTIISHGHMEITENYNVIEVETSEPMWLEVVHGLNVTNRMHFKQNDIISDVQAVTVFGLNPEKIKIQTENSFLAALIQKPKNALRLFKQYGISKTVKKVVGKVKKKLTHA